MEVADVLEGTASGWLVCSLVQRCRALASRAADGTIIGLRFPPGVQCPPYLTECSPHTVSAFQVRLRQTESTVSVGRSYPVAAGLPLGCSQLLRHGRSPPALGARVPDTR
jgi:hypothetical protein